MKTTKSILAAAVAVAAGLGMAQQASAVAINTDVITVVDESGSMSGEHAWLGGMITSLDAALTTAAGGDPLNAKYGLVGFGGSSSHLPGHQHDVGGGQLGTAAEFNTATGTLVLNGATEDGYSGMSTALSYTPSQVDALKNLILVTDEDRDTVGGAPTRAEMETALKGSLLNAVVNCTFTDGGGNTALGIDSKGNAYLADGNGGFTTSAGGQQAGGCFGSTKLDYVDLALGTGGAAWDLNQLRLGGLTADSFTAAFVAIKVKETTSRGQVPEAGTLALLGLGLLGIGAVRRRSA